MVALAGALKDTDGLADGEEDNDGSAVLSELIIADGEGDSAAEEDALGSAESDDDTELELDALTVDDGDGESALVLDAHALGREDGDGIVAVAFALADFETTGDTEALAHSLAVDETVED